MRVIYLGLSLLLLGCAEPPAPSVQSPAGPEARRLAECTLLERAHALSLARGLPAPNDILVGCPGREALRDQMPLAAQTQALRQAHGVTIPPEVTRRGRDAAIAYRRMIARGVSESIAREISQEPLAMRRGALGWGEDVPTCPGETIAFCA